MYTDGNLTTATNRHLYGYDWTSTDAQLAQASKGVQHSQLQNQPAHPQDRTGYALGSTVYDTTKRWILQACTLYVPVGLAPQPRTCARCAPFTWEGAASLAPGANVTLGSELAAFTSSHYPLYYRFTYEIEGRERPILGPAALGLWTPFAAPTVSFGWTVPTIRTPEEGLRLTPILWVADATGARSRIKQGHRYVEGVSPGNCSQLLAAVVALRTHVTNSSTTPDVVGGGPVGGQLEPAGDP